MVAGDNECTCAGCGVVCAGQFAGCPDVWARGQPLVAQAAHVVEPETLSYVEPADLAVDAGGAVPSFEDVVNQGFGATNGPGPPANGASTQWAKEDPMPPAAPMANRDVRPESESPAAPEQLPEPERPADDASLTDRVGFRTSAPSPRPQASAGEDSTSSDSEVSAIRGELQAVTDGLKLQQSMLGELLSGLTRQQAMMAELLDARHAELRLAMVAESLPDSVGEAVTKAFAANQQELSETAAKLAETLGMDQAIAKALRQVSNWSDDRFEELYLRQEKLLAKAMRAGARQATASAPKQKAPAAKKPAAAKKQASNTPATKARPAQTAQASKKAVRTSSQANRPSRRSLGS